MARYLDENINPKDVNVNNIVQYQNNTIDVVNEIQNIDIKNLKKVFDKKMRLLSEIQPSSPDNGMAWFIESK